MPQTVTAVVKSQAAGPEASVTPIPIPQPIAQQSSGGVSVQITWIYADADRIGVEYHVAGVKIPQGYTIYCPVSSVTMTDSSGKDYETYTWPSPNPISENMIFRCQPDADGKDYTITQNYYRKSSGDFPPEELTLRIALGGFDIFSKGGQQATLPANGPFIFHLTPPISPSLTLKTDQVKSENGISVQINRVEINPDFTNAYMCISNDNHQGWYPDITLMEGGRLAQVDIPDSFRMDTYHQTFSTYLSQFTTERCYRYTFNIPAPASAVGSEPLKIVITLNSLTINAMDAATQQDCYEAAKKAQVRYPNLDFSCTIDTSDPGKYGFSIQINKLPAGMDEATAHQIAEDGFQRTIQGPIHFEIPIP